MGNYYPPFSLRIPEELIEKIKYIAIKNKRSANKEMEHIIQSYVDDWEKGHEIINRPPRKLNPRLKIYNPANQIYA